MLGIPWSMGLCGPTPVQRVLLERIPRVHDVQSAWLLLLHCASARANYQLRSVPPNATADFASTHDAGLWRCLCSILQLDPAQPDSIHETAIVPLSLGGLGFRLASRTRACNLVELGGLFRDASKAPPGCGCPTCSPLGRVSKHTKFAGRCWCRQVLPWSPGI